MPRNSKYQKKKKITMTPQLRKFVQNQIQKNLETKHHSNDSSGISITNTQTDVQVPVIPQGDDEYRRTGNKINATGFYGRFHIVSSSSGLVRLVMYIPKDPSVTMTGLNTYELLDRNKFTILHDKLVTLSASGPSNRVHTIAYKFNKGSSIGLPIEWASSTTTDVTRNNIHLAFVSDVTSGIAMDFHWALYFKDA